MESSQASDNHEKLQLNGSENFPGELQITLQLGFKVSFWGELLIAHHQKARPDFLLIIHKSSWELGLGTTQP